jgi:hypothetical protein
VRPLLLIPVIALLGCTLATRADAAWPVLSGPYFGQKPPGLRAELFAPGIVSSEHHDDGPPAFSADGRECFWRVNGDHDGVRRTGRVFWSREERGRWTEPRLLSFTDPHGAGIPCLRPDGQRLYFWSRHPRAGDGSAGESHPWYADRTPAGWSEPRPLPLPVGDRRLSIFTVGADGSLLCVLEEPGRRPGAVEVDEQAPALGHRLLDAEVVGHVERLAGHHGRRIHVGAQVDDAALVAVVEDGVAREARRRGDG